jgi:hypothetical protein
MSADDFSRPDLDVRNVRPYIEMLRELPPGKALWVPRRFMDVGELLGFEMASFLLKLPEDGARDRALRLGYLWYAKGNPHAPITWLFGKWNYQVSVHAWLIDVAITAHGLLENSRGAPKASVRFIPLDFEGGVVLMNAPLQPPRGIRVPPDFHFHLVFCPDLELKTDTDIHLLSWAAPAESWTYNVLETLRKAEIAFALVARIE